MKPRLNRTTQQLSVALQLFLLGCSSTNGETEAPTTSSGGSTSSSTSAIASGAGTGLGGKSGGGGGGIPAASGAGSTGITTPVSCRVTGDGKTTLTFVNRCTSRLRVRGSNGVTGEIEPGAYHCVDIGTDQEPLNSLRYWGFIGEDPGGEHHTLAEMTLNTDFNDFDWYNLSHVDAHNLPMQIVPVDKSDCRTLTCSKSLLADCPLVGLYRDSSGQVISCVSPERDNPNSPVAQYFEASCKDAYSWSGDDTGSMAACAGEDYDVVFCP